jgi:hypothetical protein
MPLQHPSGISHFIGLEVEERSRPAMLPTRCGIDAYSSAIRQRRAVVGAQAAHDDLIKESTRKENHACGIVKSLKDTFDQLERGLNAQGSVEESVDADDEERAQQLEDLRHEIALVELFRVDLAMNRAAMMSHMLV